MAGYGHVLKAARSIMPRVDNPAGWIHRVKLMDSLRPGLRRVGTASSGWPRRSSQRRPRSGRAAPFTPRQVAAVHGFRM